MTVKKLDLQLNSEIERGIYPAKEKFDNTVKGLDIAELQVYTYGKDYIKNKKLSPDAVMQLAFLVRRLQGLKTASRILLDRYLSSVLTVRTISCSEKSARQLSFSQ